MPRALSRGLALLLLLALLPTSRVAATQTPVPPHLDSSIWIPPPASHLLNLSRKETSETESIFTRPTVTDNDTLALSLLTRSAQRHRGRRIRIGIALSVVGAFGIMPVSNLGDMDNKRQMGKGIMLIGLGVASASVPSLAEKELTNIRDASNPVGQGNRTVIALNNVAKKSKMNRLITGAAYLGLAGWQLYRVKRTAPTISFFYLFHSLHSDRSFPLRTVPGMRGHYWNVGARPVRTPAHSGRHYFRVSYPIIFD